ncbi:MAG TPA: hypothetical protein VHB70_19815 [Parafilimonas sp.]|nr:hypothetical protein [Parafilimonas sp.]
MKFTLLLIALLFSFTVFSQTTVKLEDAAKHVGDSVVVCGKVADAAFVESMENSPTFLNLGAAYPNQLLNLVIWKNQRDQYDPAPEVLYVNKNVCVTGKIELINDLPEIVIYDKSQLKITD